MEITHPTYVGLEQSRGEETWLDSRLRPACYYKYQVHPREPGLSRLLALRPELLLVRSQARWSVQPGFQ